MPTAFIRSLYDVPNLGFFAVWFTAVLALAVVLVWAWSALEKKGARRQRQGRQPPDRGP